MSNIIKQYSYSQNHDVSSKLIKINNPNDGSFSKYDLRIENRFQIQNRRYLGSKFKLCPFIKRVYENKCFDINSVGDIFAGTGCVANMFNSLGKKVYVNDLLFSNYLIYQTFFFK